MIDKSCDNCSHKVVCQRHDIIISTIIARKGREEHYDNIFKAIAEYCKYYEEKTE